MMARYIIRSLGADIIVTKQLVNLLTGEFVPVYAPIDYFATMDDFINYVRILNEYVNKNTTEIPKSFKEAFGE